MSNLTSASNEATLSSSSNKNEVGTLYPIQQITFASVPINSNNQIETNKKKRNLPGNPDPEAEVISMSPRSLMATNRFVCEICSKGFQRDQNLQLHRRGHNLPWKLKQRSKHEVVRKKVYVCPEPSCVHHEPARALGDLTGIKKHFSRKHGEKKWKCEKCSKRYAVQSDWKAHYKICGTREYRCDCGTLFSRRDSFITHRAFCGALAGENARSPSSSSSLLPINFPLKTEPQLNPNIITNALQQNYHHLPSWYLHHHHQQQNPNPNLPAPSSLPHMSATALLQKAAQMGVTMSKPATSTNPTAIAMSQILHTNCTSVGSPAFQEAYNGMLSSAKIIHGTGFDQEAFFPQASGSDAPLNHPIRGGGGKNDELTRDFLGLTGFPPTADHHFLSMASLDHLSSSAYIHHHLQQQEQQHNQNSNQNENQFPWHG